MPVFERGDMWSVLEKTDFFCVTTNMQYNRHGNAVMGAGMAKQAAQYWPKIAGDFGHILRRFDPSFDNMCSLIGAYPINNTNQYVRILYFMVKEHWKDNASLELIDRSSRALAHHAYLFPERRFDLNFPGIGNGRLRKEAVLDLLTHLPDNVHIWEYKSEEAT